MLMRWSGRLHIASLILGGLLMAIGAVLPWLHVAFGAPLPWVHNGFNNTAGLSFDEGKITFALGLLAVLMGILRIFDRTDLLRWLTIVVGFSLGVTAIVLAVTKIMDIRSLQDMLGYLQLPISIGVGLYLTVAGGVVTAVGSLFGIVPDRRPRSERFKWVAPPQDSIGEPTSDLRLRG